MTESGYMESEPLPNIENINFKDTDIHVPESMQSPDIIGNFSTMVSVLEEYSNEMGEEVSSEIVRDLEDALKVADETSREVGYHDKRHGVDFAAALLAQSLELKHLLDRTVDPTGQKSLAFIGDRMGSEFVTLENLANLRETFTLDKIMASAVCAVMHDRGELEEKKGHEVRGVQEIREEDHPALVQHMAAPVLLSTQYNVANPGVVVTSWYGETDPSGESYGMADKMIGYLACASDYIDKMSHPEYYDFSWYDLAKDIKSSDGIGPKDISKYVLLLLSAENYNRNATALREIYSYDLPTQLVAYDFIKGTFAAHDSSFRLIEESEMLPDSVKERFKRKEEEFLTPKRDEILDAILDPTTNANMTELVVRTAYILRAKEYADSELKAGRRDGLEDRVLGMLSDQSEVIGKERSRAHRLSSVLARYPGYREMSESDQKKLQKQVYKEIVAADVYPE